jgi:hypothetical protein
MKIVRDQVLKGTVRTVHSGQKLLLLSQPTGEQTTQTRHRTQLQKFTKETSTLGTLNF